MGNQVKITPKVLLWARETAGMSREDAAGKLKVKSVTAETIAEWESGVGAPTYPQLERIAKILRRPIAVFFFPSPPVEPGPKEKFRSLPEVYAEEIPTRMRFLVRDGLFMQMNLRELLGEVNPSEKKIFKDIKADDNVSVARLAARVREYMGISLQDQFAWESDDDALKAWRRALEECGLWIFKAAFGEEGYCGFCLHDKQFPVVYVNNSRPKTRQIFTLFHELAHLLRGKGGVDMRQSAMPKLSNPYKREEVFCNAFASAMLVPDRGFSADVRNPDDRHIEKLANQYKVSREVILRRYRDKNLVTSEEYESRVKAWGGKPPPKNLSTGGGDYYATLRSYLGEKYLHTAFQQYYQQKINKRELAEYLGVKTKSLDTLESYALEG